MTTFKDLGLNPDIMKSLDALGFEEPTTIQEKAIPFILESKKDLIALAQTGTGKTAAFGLPILNQIDTSKKNLQAIILCPTRELCLQISRDIETLAKHSKKIDVTPVYGGERIDIQMRKLKAGTNVVVGTPGRVSDLIRRNVLKLQNIDWVVLDEADEMLDMGFKDDLDAILEQTPSTRQTLLFSATMSKSVYSIASKYMKNAEEISAGTKNVGAENVTHEYYVVQSRDRFEALKRIIDSLPGVYGILFCRTRRETQEIADKLKRAHYSAEAIHGEISQAMRTKIMDRFRNKDIKLLVATDVAARGIDVSDLSHVINYNLPDANETYTHRTGRTGRAKKKGVAISIVLSRDTRTIRTLENIVGKEFELKKVPTGDVIFQKQIDSFVKEIKDIDTEETKTDRYTTELSKRLKELTKDDLIKHLITYKFSHMIEDFNSARELDARPRAEAPRICGENTVDMKISIGKKDGLDIKGLFSIINCNKRLKGIEIGRIDLMPEYSTFTVEKKVASEVIRQIGQEMFRGKKILIKQTGTSSGGGSGSGGRSRSGGGSRYGSRSGGGGGYSNGRKKRAKPGRSGKRRSGGRNKRR